MCRCVYHTVFVAIFSAAVVVTSAIDIDHAVDDAVRISAAVAAISITAIFAAVAIFAISAARPRDD